MNTTLFFQSLKDSLNENDQKILIESAKTRQIASEANQKQ